MLVLFDYKDPASVANVEAFTERLSRRALAMDGTCTGEHGVGQGKMSYLDEELGGALDVMRSVKKGLDPENIFNPGKIFRMAQA
ncbi:putative FAD-linked oxidoreductase [compost metagenome]